MRSEPECRRADFEDGTPVTLADGHAWTLPLPRVRMAPADNDQGFKTVLFRPDGGVFAGLMEGYDRLTAADESTLAELARSELAIARHLLTRNYDLSADEVAALVQFSYDRDRDPEGYAIREDVMGVAFGYGGPKPSAVGGASPSSPTA